MPYGGSVYGYSYYGFDPTHLWVEGDFLEIERALIESEPPGLFPQNQDSYWGQTRRVIAETLQKFADLLAVYYLNQSARTTNEDDMREWEEMLGIPVQTALDPEQRRKIIMSRLVYGPFTRTNRRNVVELYIVVTFGQPPALTADGVPLVSEGVPLLSDAPSIQALYNIVENVENFSYEVRISNTIAIDDVGLARDLERITPASIAFAINYVAVP